MANTNNTSDSFEDIMVHPALLKATDLVPAEPWISAMALINILVKDGMTKDLLLVFEGEADGVRRYNGFDDLWDAKGDCKVRMDSQDVCFDSKIIFGTNSQDLISLVSEGTHYHFKLPPLGEDMEKVDRYNLAVRNFIATIIHKPIVGCDLVSALKDLQIIVKHIFKLQYQPERAADFVRDYVQELKLDNFTNRPADIGRFLAWTEEVRWSRAFVETFAHCVGMLNCGFLDHESLDALSPTTRALLEHSCTHTHYRLSSAEIHMTMFGINSTFLDGLQDHAGVKKSLLAFQNFLQQHYAQVYGTWPPLVHQNSGHWLTRSVAQRLQQDFGNLYDLLVDKDINNGLTTPARADSFRCALNRRQLFALWDRQNGFICLPHSDPKAPDYSPTKIVEQEEEKGARRSSLIPAVRKHCKKAPDLANIYTHAINAETHTFLNHEISTKYQQMDTHEGRLGRWIIVYCMMQLLSRVAVDIQGLRYTLGVEYHLNADLDGTPPWNMNDFPETMRPAGPQYAWAALFARAAMPPPASGTPQRKATKARFKVVHLADGRVMLKDPDGHVVFR
ncbi:unnamed protein product [Aureobasidium vineae]|uniref:DUF8004 domain-containing protein n=1 Tax=Aureobasidium vineae TaxID=2773715 RepID=A0A9N8PAM3_9PEZI|nr:unnamed protein product [Aureobasidium vineae]